MRLVPGNCKLIGQYCQKLNVCLTNLDFQTPFLSEKLSGFLSSRSQTTILLFQKMINFPYRLFSSFPRKLIGLKLRKLCICATLLCIRTFFQIYRLHFFINSSMSKFYIFSSLQMRSDNFYYCFQNFDWLRLPKFAEACDSSWDSNSSFSKPPACFSPLWPQWTLLCVYKVIR